MSSKNIVVLGSLHYDIFIESDKIPEVGETVLGKKWYPKLGGKGANQAAALIKENINVNFVSAVGNDDFANYLMNQLRKNNISDKFELRKSEEILIENLTENLIQEIISSISNLNNDN